MEQIRSHGNRSHPGCAAADTMHWQSEVFIPETHAVDLDVDLEHAGTTLSHFDLDCTKKNNHDQFIKLRDLTLESLPLSWRDESVLKDLKQIGQRVVHLTVLELSPSRREDKVQEGSTPTTPCTPRRTSPVAKHHEGSGFLTFNEYHGPVVHTSKHVVRDRFEAERTVVRLFYHDDQATGTFINTLRWLRDNLHQPFPTQLPFKIPLQRSDRDSSKTSADPLLFTADGLYFESFVYSDYTIFSCDPGLVNHFPARVRTHPSFSYVKGGNKQLVLGPQLDAAVISHPHGTPKSIAFGKMKPLARLLPAMYDAPTCPGSSGAPFLRLHTNTSFVSPEAIILKEIISTSSEGQHFVSAGLFVHHGFYPRRLKLGMGTVRPPITLSFPAKQSWKKMVCWVWNTLSLCEDFLLYWMLLMFDQQQVEPFIKDHLDTFILVVPLAGVIFSLDANLLRVLWTGFWMHITCSILHWFVQGPHITPVVCGSFSAAFSVLMCLTGWCVLQRIPQPYNFVAVSILWYIALLIESKYSFHKWFFDWFIKTFRAGKLIPSESCSERKTSESQSFSTDEQEDVPKCESWIQNWREKFICWWEAYQPRALQFSLGLQKSTVLTLVSIIFSINWTLLGILWTSVCLYICCSCLRGSSSCIPGLENAFFRWLARKIDTLKQTRLGRYLHHFCPFPSDIRGAFHWLVRGSNLTETIYGPVTLFLGPAILLVVWTALLIEPPPFVAVILFLLPRRPVFRMKPSFSQDFPRSESTDVEKEETSLKEESKADLECASQSKI